MKLQLINFLAGTCRIKATGTFAERIINITKEMGIFIQDISRVDENTIIFTISSQGAKRLFSSPLPEDVEVTVEKKKGVSNLFYTHRKRFILITAPFIIMLLLFFSTQIIWHVNIIGADSETENRLLRELEKHGVKKGVFKFTIDQSFVKNRILISNPDIMWIWVDIRGSSAIVKFAPRAVTPPVFDENEFHNVYSTHDAVITKITPTNGVAKAKVGDTVLKGQLLIEGVMPLDAENTKFIHASGEVLGAVWEEATFTIPKKNEIRTPTGKKIEHLSINFKNFHIKLHLNSSILYANYDIIEDNRKLVFMPVTFTKKEYHEVEVSYMDNDTEKIQKDYETEFHTSLIDKGFDIAYSESLTEDEGDSIILTVRALCEEPISKERRMYIGEDNSVTDN